MIKRKCWETLYKAVLLVVVFLLASEPVLVAAKPQEVDPRQEAIDTLTVSGDVYLTNVANALFLNTELVNSISAIRTTPLTELSESVVVQMRADALRGAESSAIVLGSIDDLASSIDTLGGVFPAAFNALQRTNEGLPQELREGLIQVGNLTSADVASISTGMNDLLSTRQNMISNGMPAEISAQLSQAGFSQTEIDQIALVAGTRGLANTNLTTSLAQFRATQDEWAQVRTSLLILNIQLMGYQIGVRQANGIGPQAVTDAELQEIAQDELRVLVHVAHLQEMWGTDPDLAVGEGDWWFIEHYARRAAERLDALVIESQNRGLIQDLFVLQEMELLALTAKNGDADYVKAELDGLGEVLSYLVGDNTFISRQRDELQGIAYVAARLVVHTNLREKVEWRIEESEFTTAAKYARLRLDEMGVQNLAPASGVVKELNESNNSKSLLFIAGLSFSAQLRADVLQAVLSILSQATPENYVMWIKAILTGDTDNPILIGANIGLSLIPIIGVIPDIITLVIDDSFFVKALSLVGIIGSLGDLWFLLFPGLQPVGGAAFLGDAASAVMKVLFRHMDEVFQGTLDLLKLRGSFDIIIDFLKVTIQHVGSSIGHNLDEAVLFLRELFTGGFKLWDNFVFYVRAAGTQLLARLGYTGGCDLVGAILRLLPSGTVDANILPVLKNIGDELLGAGIKLSDEAKMGLGHATKIFSGNELQGFLQKVAADNPDLLENILKSIKKLNEAGLLDLVGKLKSKIGLENLSALMTKYAGNPNDLDLAKYIFSVLGNPNVSADAVRMAMKQGGPEGAEALSLWARSDFVGGPIKINGQPILENKNFAYELALRAGKDKKALEAVSKLRELTDMDSPEAKRLIAEIAENSVNGNGTFHVLGPWNNWDGGYVDYWRTHGGQFYGTHPVIYQELMANFTEEKAGKILWSINEQALNGPIAKRMPFKYTLSGLLSTDVPKEQSAIEAIWRGGTDAEIEARVRSELGLLPGANLPQRMKELILLYKNGYRRSFLSSSRLYELVK